MTDHKNSYDPPLEQYLSASAEFCTDVSTEAETYYYLLGAAEAMRPSIIFSLAKIARDQRHFCDLIQHALFATNCLGRAESIAAAACESFDADHDADAAWSLVLLAAGQGALPDEDWIEARDMCRRLHEGLRTGSQPEAEDWA